MSYRASFTRTFAAADTAHFARVHAAYTARQNASSLAQSQGLSDGPYAAAVAAAEATRAATVQQSLNQRYSDFQSINAVKAKLEQHAPYFVDQPTCAAAIAALNFPYPVDVFSA